MREDDRSFPPLDEDLESPLRCIDDDPFLSASETAEGDDVPLAKSDWYFAELASLSKVKKCGDPDGLGKILEGSLLKASISESRFDDSIGDKSAKASLKALLDLFSIGESSLAVLAEAGVSVWCSPLRFGAIEEMPLRLGCSATLSLALLISDIIFSAWLSTNC